MIEIIVRYSCTLCGVRDRTLAVPAREEAENVVVWMERTIALIGADHHEQQPGCIARQLHDLKIPMDGADWIGGPAIQ